MSAAGRSASAGGGRRLGFSTARVSWREWVGFGSGIVAILATFLPWTNLSASRQDVEEALRALPAGDVARNAWTTGFLSWSGPILLLLAGVAVVVFGQVRVARVSGLPHQWLVTAAVAIVLMVLGWVAIDRQFDEDARAVLEAGGVAIEGGLGRYLGLLAALASLVASALDVRATRRHGVPPKGRG